MFGSNTITQLESYQKYKQFLTTTSGYNGVTHLFHSFLHYFSPAPFDMGHVGTHIMWSATHANVVEVKNVTMPICRTFASTFKWIDFE